MKVKQYVKSIYILLNQENGNVKIGCSEAPKKRCAAIRSGCGCEVVLKHNTKPVYNYLELEKLMHNHFSNDRIIGEWFRIDIDEAIDKLKELFDESNVCKIVKMIEIGLNATAISEGMESSRSGVVKYLNSIEYNIKQTEEEVDEEVRKFKYSKPKFKTSISKSSLEEMVRKSKAKKNK